jgi:hypothetical protein
LANALPALRGGVLAAAAGEEQLLAHRADAGTDAGADASADARADTRADTFADARADARSDAHARADARAHACAHARAHARCWRADARADAVAHPAHACAHAEPHTGRGALPERLRAGRVLQPGSVAERVRAVRPRPLQRRTPQPLHG